MSSLDPETAKQIRDEGEAAMYLSRPDNEVRQAYLRHLKQFRPAEFQMYKEAGLLKHAAAIADKRQAEAAEANWKAGMSSHEARWEAMREHIYPESEEAEEAEAKRIEAEEKEAEDEANWKMLLANAPVVSQTKYSKTLQLPDGRQVSIDRNGNQMVYSKRDVELNEMFRKERESQAKTSESTPES